MNRTRDRRKGFSSITMLEAIHTFHKQCSDLKNSQTTSLSPPAGQLRRRRFVSCTKPPQRVDAQFILSDPDKCRLFRNLPRLYKVQTQEPNLPRTPRDTPHVMERTDDLRVAGFMTKAERQRANKKSQTQEDLLNAREELRGLDDLPDIPPPDSKRFNEFKRREKSWFRYLIPYIPILDTIPSSCPSIVSLRLLHEVWMEPKLDVSENAIEDLLDAARHADNLGDEKKALESYSEVQALEKDLRNPELETFVALRIAQVKFSAGEIQEALTENFELWGQAESEGDDFASAKILACVGSSFFRMKEYDLALKTFYASLKKRARLHGLAHQDSGEIETANEAISLNNIAVVLFALRRFRQSFLFLIGALDALLRELPQRHPRVQSVIWNLEKMRPNLKLLLQPCNKSNGYRRFAFVESNRSSLRSFKNRRS